MLQAQARAPGWPADRIARALQGPAAMLVLDFQPATRQCPHCGADLRSQKSKTRTLSTLATGTFRARELRRCCPRCPSPPLVSQQLADLAPPGQRYGYDLIVRAGLQRYHHMRQRQEIRAALARRGIALSDGSVSALCDRFLQLLAALHRQRAPALRAAMEHGYPLHIDATCDKGQGGLFLCLDGWRGWVLHAARIRSENAAELHPAIQATLDAFGHPVAFMRDLGSAAAKAVAACRQPPAVDLVCHFHFLAAVGRKLMDADHAALKRSLARCKIRSGLRALLRALRPQGRLPAGHRREQDLPALLLWVLEGDGRKQPSYPFGLTHWNFYQRCRQFDALARQRLHQPRSRREQRTLQRAAQLLQPVQQRAFGMPAIAARLARSQSAFRELRDVLRLRHDALRGRDRPAPSSPEGSAARLAAIADRVKAYRNDLRQRVAAARAQAAHADSLPEAVVLAYLDRYQGQLFGHPIARDAAGRVVAVVERTNNPAEQFFSQAKRKLRRRLGRAYLGRDMQDQPAQAALAANLLDPHYVEIVCGTLDELPRAFAALEQSGAVTAKTVLDRNQKNADLRRRIREWAVEPANVPKGSPPHSGRHPQNPSTAVIPN